MKNEIKINDILMYSINDLHFEIFKPWCNEKYIDKLSTISFEENCITFENAEDYYFDNQIDNEISIKLLLRPMSDLFKSEFLLEAEKILNRKIKIEDTFIDCIENFSVKYYIFLIKNKFDINNFTERGLAKQITL